MPRLKVYAKKNTMTDLGHCITDRRRRLGLSQAELAKKMGVTQSQISRMENNPELITQADMYELNKALNLDIFSILKAFGFSVPAIRDYFREYFKDHK